MFYAGEPRRVKANPAGELPQREALLLPSLAEHLSEGGFAHEWTIPLSLPFVNTNVWGNCSRAGANPGEPGKGALMSGLLP